MALASWTYRTYPLHNLQSNQRLVIMEQTNKTFRRLCNRSLTCRLTQTRRCGRWNGDGLCGSMWTSLKHQMKNSYYAIANLTGGITISLYSHCDSNRILVLRQIPTTSDLVGIAFVVIGMYAPHQ